MLPGFTADGLLPPGEFELTFSELRSSLLVVGPGFSYPNWDSEWRTELVGNLEVLVNQLWEVGITDIFVDGSFVEDKEHPNDIDGYFVCSTNSENPRGARRFLLTSTWTSTWTWTWTIESRWSRTRSKSRTKSRFHDWVVGVSPRCDVNDLASGRLQSRLNVLDPHKVWTWDPATRRPFRGYPKKQLPMWHLYRVEMYPHFVGLSSGIRDKFGNELEFPSAFRLSRRNGQPRGIVKIKKGDQP